MRRLPWLLCIPLLLGVARGAEPTARDRPAGMVTACYTRGIAGEAYDPSDLDAKVRVILRYATRAGREVTVRRLANMRGRRLPGITMPGHAFKFYRHLPEGTAVTVSAQGRDGREFSLGAFLISTQSASITYDTTAPDPGDPPADEQEAQGAPRAVPPPEDPLEEDPLVGLPELK